MKLLSAGRILHILNTEQAVSSAYTELQEYKSFLQAREASKSQKNFISLTWSPWQRDWRCCQIWHWALKPWQAVLHCSASAGRSLRSQLWSSAPLADYLAFPEHSIELSNTISETLECLLHRLRLFSSHSAALSFSVIVFRYNYRAPQIVVHLCEDLVLSSSKFKKKKPVHSCSDMLPHKEYTFSILHQKAECVSPAEQKKAIQWEHLPSF